MSEDAWTNRDVRQWNPEVAAVAAGFSSECDDEMALLQGVAQSKLQERLLKRMVVFRACCFAFFLGVLVLRTSKDL